MLDDLLRARQKAKQAEYTSDLNTDEENIKRVVKRPRKLLLSSDEEEINNNYPRPPNILESKNFTPLFF